MKGRASRSQGPHTGHPRRGKGSRGRRTPKFPSLKLTVPYKLYHTEQTGFWTIYFPLPSISVNEVGVNTQFLLKGSILVWGWVGGKKEGSQLSQHSGFFRSPHPFDHVDVYDGGARWGSWKVFLGWVVCGSMVLTLFPLQEKASAADVGPLPVCLLQDNTEPGGPVSPPWWHLWPSRCKSGVRGSRGQDSLNTCDSRRNSWSQYPLIQSPRNGVAPETGWLWKSRGSGTLMGREEMGRGQGFGAFLPFPPWERGNKRRKGLASSLTTFWPATRFQRRAQLYGSTFSLVCPPC